MEKIVSRDPLVSVIIVNYNGLEHLKICLDSVLNTEYPNFEILFVDNNSMDGSVHYVQQNYASIKIIRTSENLGFGAAANRGIASSSGKYVAFLNEDIEVDQNWLTPLVNCMENFPNVAVCEGKMLLFYNRNVFDYACGAGRFIDKFGNVIIRGWGEEDRGQYNKSIKTFYAFTLYRKVIFDEVGLFDTDFFLYYEETDLCWRIRLKSYEIVYVPSSIIYHKGKKGESSSNRKYYFVKNKLMMLVKNYSLRSIFCILPIVFIDYFLELVFFIIRSDLNNALNIITGTFYFITNFKNIWIKHQRVQLDRILSDNEIIQNNMVPYNGNLVSFIRYFVRTK